MLPLREKQREEVEERGPKRENEREGVLQYIVDWTVEITWS
jgi:hypothetical protein